MARKYGQIFIFDYEMPPVKDKPIHLFAVFAVAQAILFWVTRHDPFFGDAVSGVSRAAVHIYEKKLHTLFFLPQHDPGHPTLFPVLLAAAWMVLGKKLWVAHLLVNLFATGTLYLTWRTAKRYLTGWWPYLPVLLLTLSATYLAQSAMLTNHMPLTFFYLLAFTSLREKRTLLFVLASCAMVLLHLQAVFMLLAMAAAEVYLHTRVSRQNWGILFKETLWWFVPSALVFLGWGYVHAQHTGWAYSSPVFAEHRVAVGVSGFLKHVLISFWRLADYGYLVLYVPFLLLFRKPKTLQHLFLKDEITVSWLVHLTITALLICATLNYSPGHRYFFPFSTLLCVSSVVALKEAFRQKPARWMLGVSMAVVLVLGNYWYYPGKCLGDATLAYRNYFDIEKQIAAQLPDSVKLYTYAPLASHPKYTRLTDEDLLTVEELYGKSLTETPAVLQSNCNCEFNPIQLDILATWKGKSFEQHAVYVNVLFNPDYYPAPPLNEPLRTKSRVETWMEQAKKH
jgi:hypothetical protein